MAPGPRVEDKERESRRTRRGCRRKGKSTAPQGGDGEGACVALGGCKAAAAWACRGMVQLARQGPLGLWGQGRLQQTLKRQCACSVACYGVMRKVSPFDRRVTCLAWHPSRPGTLAVASKGGDVLLWDHRALEPLSFLLGNGPGDAVGGMRFDPRDTARVFVVSGDGSLLLRDVERRAGPRGHIVANAPQCVHRHRDCGCWYCSVDVSVPRQALAVGDNLGHLEMCGLEGTPIWRRRLHKKKVTHVEFHPYCEWLLASASVDQTVKLWDLRAITDAKSFLHTLPHDKPVNSAYFSPGDGARLLTTDQYHQIRVYGCSDWSTPLRTIVHPHRQFQHLTPIKATWHPRYDLAVIGRYPDLAQPGTSVEDSRSIDLFDTDSGALLCRLEDPLAPGIASDTTPWCGVKPSSTFSSSCSRSSDGIWAALAGAALAGAALAGAALAGAALEVDAALRAPGEAAMRRPRGAAPQRSRRSCWRRRRSKTAPRCPLASARRGGSGLTRKINSAVPGPSRYGCLPPISTVACVYLAFATIELYAAKLGS